MVVDGGYTCRDVVCGGSTFKKSDKNPQHSGLVRLTSCQEYLTCRLAAFCPTARDARRRSRHPETLWWARRVSIEEP